MTDLVEEAPPYRVSAYASARRHAARAARAGRRTQLLAAASRTFVQRGYHGAGMDEIAGSAGVSKPVLYQHFSGKLELYLAVLHGHSDVLVERVVQALRSASDNHQRVQAAVQAYFDFVDDEAQGFRLVFGSEVVSEPSVQWTVEQATDACVNAVFDVVEQYSSLDPYQARVFAVGLVGASQVTARYWVDSGRPGSKREAVEATVALCWGGLSGVPLQNVDRLR
ncbi:TetR/AcrR family transcriptional regulator [Nocardia fluminea]|uniref:TetR/AcrR family transcriptional regulator n=1 Tax=Nocardia fluminea TaxID=134984 RepID=UPI0036707519